MKKVTVWYYVNHLKWLVSLITIVVAGALLHCGQHFS